MACLSKLFLFVHLTPPREATARDAWLSRWLSLIEAEGSCDQNAICILTSSPTEIASVTAAARQRFGDRCVLDPSDDSDATRLLLAEDLRRMLKNRGRFCDWIPYEIWTSGMARQWTEGLRRALQERGLAHNPETLQVIACGQQWAGCLTKYSMLMPAYLGVNQTPEIRVDLSPGAGWPFEARFVERVPMDRHVSLFLFETPDGRPMGQFLDGLRPIWEPPHLALLPASPLEIESTTVSPNSYVLVDPSSPGGHGGLIAHVGDGCQPRFTTLRGPKGGYQEFRGFLANACIVPAANPQRTSYMACVPGQ